MTDELGRWLKYFIKGLKESLKTGLRYHPRDDDVAKLEQIMALIQKPTIDGKYMKKKAEAMHFYMGLKEGMSLAICEEFVSEIISDAQGREVTEEWIEKKIRKMCHVLDVGSAIYAQEAEDFIRSLVEEMPAKKGFPEIVCLCGSTRFMNAFFEQGWIETLNGKIVLSVGVCKHANNHGGEALGPKVVQLLDELHFRKIDLADEVLILNVGGYIGESTQNELNYARKKGKIIRFLETEKASIEVKK